MSTRETSYCIEFGLDLRGSLAFPNEILFKEGKPGKGGVELAWIHCRCERGNTEGGIMDSGQWWGVGGGGGGCCT